MTSLTDGVRTTGKAAKKVAGDTLNGAIIGAMVFGLWSLVTTVRRVSQGRGVDGKARA